MTAMATLWQANDSFRTIGASFFEINGIFNYTLSILLKFRKFRKLFLTLISNLTQESRLITYKQQQIRSNCDERKLLNSDKKNRAGDIKRYKRR